MSFSLESAIDLSLFGEDLPVYSCFIDISSIKTYGKSISFNYTNPQEDVLKTLDANNIVSSSISRSGEVSYCHYTTEFRAEIEDGICNTIAHYRDTRMGRFYTKTMTNSHDYQGNRIARKMFNMLKEALESKKQGSLTIEPEDIIDKNIWCFINTPEFRRCFSWKPLLYARIRPVPFWDENNVNNTVFSNTTINNATFGRISVSGGNTFSSGSNFNNAVFNGPINIGGSSRTTNNDLSYEMIVKFMNGSTISLSIDPNLLDNYKAWVSWLMVFGRSITEN